MVMMMMMMRRRRRTVTKTIDLMNTNLVPAVIFFPFLLASQDFLDLLKLRSGPGFL
jgi:hypothetical protein